MDSFSCTPVMTEVAQTNGKNICKMSSLCTYNVAWHIFLGVLQKHTHTHTQNIPVVLKALLLLILCMALTSFIMTTVTSKAEISTL